MKIITNVNDSCHILISNDLTYPKFTTGRVDPDLWKPGEYSAAWYGLSPGEASEIPFL